MVETTEIAVIVGPVVVVEGAILIIIILLLLLLPLLLFNQVSLPIAAIQRVFTI